MFAMRFFSRSLKAGPLSAWNSFDEVKEDELEEDDEELEDDELDDELVDRVSRPRVSICYNHWN